jgi:hypothetical protein
LLLLFFPQRLLWKKQNVLQQKMFPSITKEGKRKEKEKKRKQIYLLFIYLIFNFF